MSTHGCNVPCQKKGGGQERKAQSSLGRGLSLSRGAGKASIGTSHPSAKGKSRILVQNPQPLASNLLLFIFLTFKVLEISSALSLPCPKKADTYMWTSEASSWVTWTRQHLLSTSYSTMKKHFHQSTVSNGGHLVHLQMGIRDLCFALILGYWKTALEGDADS